MKILFLLLFLSPGLFADSKPLGVNIIPKETERTGITGLAMDLVRKVPGDFGIAINTYLDVMQPGRYRHGDGDVGVANRGLAGHFSQEMDKDSCLKKLAGEFAMDLEIYVAAGIPMIRSKLSDLEGSLYQPGWVWKKAMALSANNPNLAIKLIGICGHDDISQSEKIRCPLPSSSFFYPEGLGKDIDTSQSIKEYVAQTQSVHADPSLIKAKNYHIYGAAYLACQMIERGLSAASAPDFSQKFAFIYRRIRTCRAAADSLLSFRAEEEQYQADLAKFNRGGSKGKKPEFETYLKTSLKKKIAKIGLAESYASDSRIKRVSDTYYASKVYFDVTQCPDGKASELGEAMRAGSAKLTSIYKDSMFLPDDFDQRCETIAGNRCADAKKVLATWDADFKWTMDQHRVGAEFAAMHCKPASELKKYPTPPSCKTMSEPSVFEINIKNTDKGVK